MPELDDDRGVSAITINSTKGQNALHSTDAELYTAPYEDLCAKNPSLLHSCKIPEKRETFFKFTKKNFFNHINRLLKVSLIQRIKWRLYTYIGKLRSLLTR